ncbi:putative permease [Spiribacter salinus M19-40]|uniref:Putative permease n=1 Tax=Spiribacter salinus M19-40 TaxID=1260251 RepID=R4V2C2_9GAMM|nr:AI-2E family transporter [Spiribacter salinus]AGM40189.1 putative permease [Spiribacter salinus M19-40]
MMDPPAALNRGVGYPRPMNDALRIYRAGLGLALVVFTGLLIYWLQPILTPFIAGALLAYLGDPLARRLQRLGLNRMIATSIVFLLLFSVLAAGVLMLIPLVGRQIDTLQSQLPGMLTWAQETGLPWLEQTFGIDFGTVDLAALRNAISEHWQSTGNVAAEVVGRISRSGMAVAGAIATLALTPVVAFYLLRDWDRVLAALLRTVPPSWRATTAQLAAECDEVVGAFVRGQLLVMISLGLFYAFGLWLVGLQLGILIGLLSGLAAIVPYLGFIVGIAAATAAVIVQYSDWLIPLLLVWVVFGAGQALESVAFTPLFVGDRIGLHPVAVIFAVLAGGQLFGFVGVLLALPIAAVVVVLLRHAHAFVTG